MKVLQRTQFGNPILRKKARFLKGAEIKSETTQELIENIRYTLLEKNLGIGLAAPQVNKNVAIAVIAIRPKPHRPTVKNFDLILVNPEIIDYSGTKEELWEGCISAGSNGTCDLFAKVPRHQKIRIKYLDEKGKSHNRGFSGLEAHVIQHEVDHLNGILFVDHVKDSTTYMTYREYVKRIKNK